MIKKQIVTRIFGGLGNQLFQYFFSNYLVAKFDVDAFMDVSYFANSIQNHERLRFNDLNLPWTDVCNSKLKYNKIYTNKYLKRLPLPRSFKLLRENSDFEGSAITNIDFDTYYEGYWQSFKYINDFQNLELINLSHLLDDKIPDIFKSRVNENNVSIHIRRGDYLTSRNHDILEMNYYEEAVKIISSNTFNPNYFIFSDDIEWAKFNFKINSSNVTFVNSFGINSDIVDLSVMKSCTHHIIANSTYSWWGAWLSWRKSKGIVIAPNKWPTGDFSSDICPAEWRRL